jgi:hypothetical protein
MHNMLNTKIKGALLTVAVMFCVSISTAQNITVSSAQGPNINSFIQNNLVGSGVYV